MKKILMTLAVVMITAMSANAQTAGQLYCQGGFNGNLSTLTNNDDAKMKLGWGVGANIYYCITDQWAVALDLSRDFIGCKSKDADENIKLDYLSFGPMAKYYAEPWLALQAGPEIGFLFSAKMDGNSVKDNFKKTELSLPIGVSFEPNLGDDDHKLVIGLRYRLGMSNVNKDKETMRNSALILSIGYKFPLLQK